MLALLIGRAFPTVTTPVFIGLLIFTPAIWCCVSRAYFDLQPAYRPVPGKSIALCWAGLLHGLAFQYGAGIFAVARRSLCSWCADAHTDAAPSFAASCTPRAFALPVLWLKDALLQHGRCRPGGQPSHDRLAVFCGLLGSLLASVALDERDAGPRWAQRRVGGIWCAPDGAFSWLPLVCPFAAGGVERALGWFSAFGTMADGDVVRIAATRFSEPAWRENDPPTDCFSEPHRAGAAPSSRRAAVPAGSRRISFAA